MDTQPSSWFVGVDDCQQKPVRRRVPRKTTKTFLEALREKYIKVQDVKTQGYVIVFHGRPKTDNNEAELAYLRNVVSGLRKSPFDIINLTVIMLNIGTDRSEHRSL